MTIEGGVHFTYEFREISDGVFLPLSGKEVIKNNVHDDSRESLAIGVEEVASLVKGRVIVSEPIKMAVHHDPVKNLVLILVAKRIGGAFDKVTEEVSHPGGIGGGSEEEVGEKVDGRFSRWNRAGARVQVRRGKMA